MSPDFPIVGIPVDVRAFDEVPYHLVGEKYVNAVAHGVGAYPLLLPAMADGAEIKAFGGRFAPARIADLLDGVFLPGSYSNVHPRRYGKPDTPPVPPVDEQRDETALALIAACVERAVPLLAVCRGFQELNVAYGGSIHPEVHEMRIFADHRERYELPREQHYEHAHAVEFTRDGLLHRIHGDTGAMVNSLHGQGIDRLGDGLLVEAVAPDGLIEAIRVDGSPAFTLGVQWHPEWRFWENELSRQIFGAFAEAAAARHAARSG